MGRKAKFEKLEKNESYYAVHGESAPQKEKGFFSKVSDAVKSKKKEIIGFDSEKIPEKRELSSKFTYKKNTKKVMYTDDVQSEAVEPVQKAPFVLLLCVMLLMLAAKYIFSSQMFESLSQKNAAVAEVLVSIAVYVVPSLCYLFSSQKAKGSHYVKKFTPAMLPFIASMLGLVLCLTALQKYYIAYTFSYSVELGAASKDLFLVLLTGAVLPALCEEFFVHGVFQKEISKYAGGICGVVASALVFAMLHFELQYFLIYFVAGTVMGTLTHVTGSVFPAMIVHFLSNTFSILFSDRLSFIAVERIGGTLLMVVLAFLSFILLIVSLRIAETISSHRAKSKTLYDKDTVVALADGGKSLAKGAKVFASPFMLISFAVFMLAIIFM